VLYLRQELDTWLTAHSLAMSLHSEKDIAAHLTTAPKTAKQDETLSSKRYSSQRPNAAVGGAAAVAPANVAPATAIFAEPFSPPQQHQVMGGGQGMVFAPQGMPPASISQLHPMTGQPFMPQGGGSGLQGQLVPVSLPCTAPHHTAASLTTCCPASLFENNAVPIHLCHFISLPFTLILSRTVDLYPNSI